MKRVMIPFLLTIVLLFGSCSPMGWLRGAMLSMGQTNDEKTASARLEQVLNVIKKKDKAALKALFSQKALKEAEDMDGRVDYLFELIQGEIGSWEQVDGPTVRESNNYGHVTKRLTSYFYVNTDKEKYFFLLEDYPVDTDHTDNVGLNMLFVVKAEDEDKMWEANDQKDRAGIFKPKE